MSSRPRRSARSLPWLLCAASCVSLLAGRAAPQGGAAPTLVQVGDQAFTSWADYTSSSAFAELGLRCRAPDRDTALASGILLSGGDCTFFVTNPADEYAPSVVYDIPVVFHVIEDSSGQGALAPLAIDSQIEILNEDFRALAGTPGSPGVDTRIQFHLATVDPSGNPTTGVTTSVDDAWFADSGDYWTSLAWDTSRYLNVYTNTAGGYLGYVPDLPQGGLAGDPQDRVVLLWSAVGLGAPIGAPFDQGRTATHEFGHFLGLFHTFEGGCGSAVSCATDGDLICDTASESTAHFGCDTGAAECGPPAPVHNYMDYSDDTCMWEFTEEQARRMRCSIEWYRPALPVLSWPWTDLGQGLAGTLGEPALSGQGPLAVGASSSMALENGAPFALTYLILGASQLGVPTRGGVLVPAVDGAVPLLLDGSGAFTAPFSVPLGVPSGTDTWWQAWVVDPSGPEGLTASNGVRGRVP